MLKWKQKKIFSQILTEFFYFVASFGDFGNMFSINGNGFYVEIYNSCNTITAKYSIWGKTAFNQLYTSTSAH